MNYKIIRLSIGLWQNSGIRTNLNPKMRNRLKFTVFLIIFDILKSGTFKSMSRQKNEQMDTPNIMNLHVKVDTLNLYSKGSKRNLKSIIDRFTIIEWTLGFRNKERKMTAKHSITRSKVLLRLILLSTYTYYVLGWNFHLDDAIKVIFPRWESPLYYDILAEDKLQFRQG